MRQDVCAHKDGNHYAAGAESKTGHHFTPWLQLRMHGNLLIAVLRVVMEDRGSREMEWTMPARLRSVAEQGLPAGPADAGSCMRSLLRCFSCHS